MVNSSNWYVPDSSTQPGSHTLGGGGGGYGADVLQARSPLDARRMSAGQLGQAQFPDGYLGSISQDRQQDKLLEKITNRLTDRSYQRGTHVGAKINGRDYFWRDGVDPMSRIKAESKAVKVGKQMVVPRHKPVGNPVERLAHMGKTSGLSAPEQMNMARKYGVDVSKNPVVNSDPTARAALVKMLPQYARTM
jgi:hypothetical protein